uniref:Uncharacterized protein n=1 Tax=Panagrolaimus sp. JU765 TaxID=591449 RepID=A0AC34PXD9_9BILA
MNYAEHINHILKTYLVYYTAESKTVDNDNFTVMVYMVQKSKVSFAASKKCVQREKFYYIWRIVDGEDPKIIECEDVTTAKIKAEMAKQMLEIYESAQKARKLMIDTIDSMKEVFKTFGKNHEECSDRFMRIVNEKEQIIKNWEELHLK